MAWIIIGIIALVIVVFLISVYNKLTKMKIKVQEAFSTMDVYLTKRHDLVPNLVETVKGYAAHEKSTFEKVIQARNMAMNGATIDEKMEGENQLTGALKTIFALSESYPDLKANTQFLNLQEQLKKVEEDIVNARKFYNAVVREYNTAIRVFPNNLVAGMFGHHDAPMYEVNDEKVRENVKVEF